MRDQLLVRDVNAHEPRYIYLGLKLPQLSKVHANVPWLTLLATFQDCISNVDHCCLTQCAFELDGLHFYEDG